MEKLEVLKEYFGHDSFREGQEGLVNSLLAGRDVLGIMPTGAGKSVCYQLPALMSQGVAIVVSPLISLMKDQVNALIQSGVRAAYLNSSLTPQQYDTALSRAARGEYKLIYVAPERLCTSSFLSFASSVRLSLLAVDEAHCVSQWGQDFRPSYMRIPEFISYLPSRPPVAAFTATATPEVKEDISRMLGLRDPYTVVTGFDRKNLFFGVVRGGQKLAEVIKVIKRNRGRSGIIYCSTRKNVELVSEALTNKGFPCTRYHAGLSDEERRQNQDDFIYDRVRLIAATNAFGMGIDKSNVGFVVHYNMPKDLESYYQEAGRAGRDGERAECILLYSSADVRTNRFIIENSSDDTDRDPETRELLRERDLERLKQMTFYSTSAGCLRQFMLRYFGEKHPGSCGSCSSCLGGFEEKDITLEAQKILSCVYRLAQRRMSLGAHSVTEILRGSSSERITSRGLNTLSTYGIMADTKAADIKLMISALEQQGCLRTEGEYSTLRLCGKARGVLSGGERVTAMLPKPAPKEKSSRRRPEGEVTVFDQGLFSRLRELRTKLAARARMPAYVIFTDAALRDICVKLPRTEEELLACSGIGRAKQQRYGKQILSEVADYIRENGTAPSEPLSADPSSDGHMLFRVLREQGRSLSPIDEQLTISAFCDSMLDRIGISADKKLIRRAIEDWYVKNGYLASDLSGRPTKTTILSEEAGLMSVKKLSRNGTEYSSIVISPEGQELLLECLDEIFTGGDS